LDDDPDAAWLPCLDHAMQPALCCAAECGCDAEIVRALLERRADVAAVDVRGRTPLHILSAMPSRDAPPPLLQSIEFPVPARVALLSALDPWCIPPLGPGRDMAVAQLLLEAHADPNCPDKSGNTPLSLATTSGKVALVHLFRNQYPEWVD